MSLVRFAGSALLWQLVERELHDRYRGSVFGFAWAFILPLSMVAVYTFVFGFVFRARWAGAGDDSLLFALFLYCGLVPYLFVADALGRAPTLLIQYASLVKKVAFPLPLLATAATMAACVHMLIGVAVLWLMAAVILGHFSLTAILVPIALLPLVIFIFGAVLMLSSSGVLFRDLAQLIPVLLPLLLFLSPVFYPLMAVPARFRAWMQANPLTQLIETLRTLIIEGSLPPAGPWLLSLLCAIGFAVFGWWWFRRLAPAFSDLL